MAFLVISDQYPDDEQLLKRAWELRESQDYESASAHYETLLARTPDHSWASLELGKVLEEIGDMEGALTAYETAVENNPNTWTHESLGMAYIKKGDAAQAKTHLTKSVEYDPDNATAKAALEIPEVAFLVISDQYPDDEQLLTRAWELRDTQDYESAATHYKALMSRSQTHPWASLELGKVLEEMGDMEGALTAYGTAVEVNPNTWTHESLGMAHLMAQNLEKAHIHLARALEYDATNASAKQALDNLS